MFEHIVLRRSERGSPLSAGEVAEALLYYQKIHLVIDRGTLFALVRQLGPQNVLLLLNRPEVSAVYCEEMLGAHTEQIGGFSVHRYVAFTLAGHETVGELKTPEARLAYELERLPIEKRVAANFAKQFLRRVPIRRYSGDHFVQAGVPEAAKQDLIDKAFCKRAIRRLLTLSPGGYDPGEALKFDVIDTDLGIQIFHNIDLQAINARRASFPQVEPLTIAFLLSQIQDACADLALSAFYGGDFVTSSLLSEVVRLRHEALLRRASINSEARDQFINVVLPDTPTLAEVIDKGERTFSEFLLLLDRSERFKHWLKTINPDEGIVRTYMQDISSESWVQKLPVKSVRYMITLALDNTNPVAGLLAGFADNFVVEKLLGGWRPNHFVSSKLGPFILGSS